jgi:hypothetical protein
VEVIAHDGVGVDRHRERLGQLEDSILDPLPPVLEVLPGGAVESTKKSAPNAATHTMEEAGLLVADQLASWIGHIAILAVLLAPENRRTQCRAVGFFLQIVGVHVLFHVLWCMSSGGCACPLFSFRHKKRRKVCRGVPKSVSVLVLWSYISGVAH